MAFILPRELAGGRHRRGLPAKDSPSPNVSTPVWASVHTKGEGRLTGDLHLEHHLQPVATRLPGTTVLQPGPPVARGPGVKVGRRGRLSRWLPLQLAKDFDDEGSVEFRL